VLIDPVLIDVLQCVLLSAKYWTSCQPFNYFVFSYILFFVDVHLRPSWS